MSRPAQAKYCPQCGAMAHADIPQCRVCGHFFWSGPIDSSAASVPPGLAPPPDDLHRTQMFSLPTLLHAPVREDAPIPEPIDPLAFAPGRAARFAVVAFFVVLILLLLAALLWRLTR